MKDIYTSAFSTEMLQDKELKASTLLLFELIWSFSRSGDVYLSNERIADCIRCHPNRVREHIKILVDKNYIEAVYKKSEKGTRRILKMTGKIISDQSVEGSPEVKGGSPEVNHKTLNLKPTNTKTTLYKENHPLEFDTEIIGSGFMLLKKYPSLGISHSQREVIQKGFDKQKLSQDEIESILVYAETMASTSNHRGSRTRGFIYINQAIRDMGNIIASQANMAVSKGKEKYYSEKEAPISKNANNPSGRRDGNIFKAKSRDKSDVSKNKNDNTNTEIDKATKAKLDNLLGRTSEALAQSDPSS